MTSDILLPRNAAKFIAENSKDITLDKEKLLEVSEKLYEVYQSGAYNVEQWKNHELNPKSMNEQSVDWIFFCDTLNFSFWSETSPRCTVIYKDKKYTGYWSLCAAINRALDENVDVLNPKFYAALSLEELQNILRTDEGPPMPMVQERLENLYEAGRVLIEKYDGKFSNVIRAAKKSAKTLLSIVVKDFQSYRDEAMFEGRQVAIYKRAQILIGDIWGCFEGQGLGEFHDIDEITAFADYRVPQTLAYFGVIKYSDRLMNRLREGSLLTSGERLEVEIRGWCIHAIELLKNEMQKKALKNSQTVAFNSILIDFYLWDYRREFANEVDRIPMHKIRCIYY